MIFRKGRMFRVFVFILSIQRGLSLLCYNCQMSYKRESCLSHQKAIKCDPKIKQPSCMSLSYGTVKDLQQTAVYSKKCVDLNMCNSLCDVMSNDAMENCKTSCCTDDGCNKEMFVEKRVVFGPKSKRANPTLTKDAPNSQRRLKDDRLILCSAILGVFLVLMKFSS